MAEQPLVIILGGPGGSGRSTLARQLARKLKLRRLYGGMFLRRLSLKAGYGVIDNKSGRLKFSEEEFVKFQQEYCPRHPEIDLEVDARLFREAQKGNVVIESMTFSPLTKRFNLDYKRVWVTASEEERARRICEREARTGNQFSVEEMRRINGARVEANRQRYLALYGFDFLDSGRYYEFVFDTTNVNEDKMAEELIKRLRD